ncbi:hypothetical protein TNCV_146871 [Trichonephila clavipes]|nr:hypothetical protein TNCV_146871 [Trichonephila clavipes]
MVTPACNKKGSAAFHSRRESITGESPTSFPEENTTKPYSGLEHEPTLLQAEDHIHHTGLAVFLMLKLEYKLIQIPAFGVVWKLGEECQLRYPLRRLSTAQNYEVRRQ